MEKLANVSFRIDANLKKEAETLFKGLGLSMTAAFNVFLNQSVREQRIPFEVTMDVPNRKTLNAFKECDEILSKRKGRPAEEVLDELKR